jgi:glutaminyl-tRNA synthetase
LATPTCTPQQLPAPDHRERPGTGTYATRHWAGSPGDAAHHAAGQPDPAKIRTRFPPEPNGYLHVGHAKSICLNFGLARDYGGVCHMRFDDTNPEKEDTEYVDSILDAVQWLGFDWDSLQRQAGAATSTRQRLLRLHVPRGGIPDRSRPRLCGRADRRRNARQPRRLRQARRGQPLPQPQPAENLARFREMRDGLARRRMVLRAKIDMASPNINMRDPAIYRIRRATHHNTGDKWCIYPMYTFAHPIEDALEQITHSICTLEFEDQRPFYDWLLERLCEGGLLKAAAPAPVRICAPEPHLRDHQQAQAGAAGVRPEGQRLGRPAHAHHRRPAPARLHARGLQLFAERIGVTKSDSWIDYSTLEGCLREDLENKAHRGMAVLDPVKLVLTNWGEVFGSDAYLEDCTQPALPHSAIAEGQTPPPDRVFKIGNEVWIEREDFEEVPPKGYKRLFPGNVVRLKGGYVIECTGVGAKDADGKVTEVHAKVIPDTKSGTPGADSVKAKAAITWVGVADGVQRRSAPVRPPVHRRPARRRRQGLPGKPEPRQPEGGDGLRGALTGRRQPDEKFQFERFGYFVADRADHGVGGQGGVQPGDGVEG